METYHSPRPPHAIRGSLIEIVEEPGLKASITLGIGALKRKNTHVLDKGNFLSFPERFKTGSYYLN